MAAGNQNRNRNQTRRDNRQNRQDRRLSQRATRDVQLMNQPQFDYNNAQLQQAQENYLRAQQSAQSASGGAYDAIGGAQRPQFGQIADQFTERLNALAPEFGGAGATVPYREQDMFSTTEGQIGMPANEVAAGNAVGSAFGTGTLGMLSNDEARWGMSREGAQQEASIFGRNSEAQLRQQMLDTIQGHENEQQNLMAQQPYQIKSRLDELKDQAIEEQLARSKMRSDAAFSQAIQDQLGGMLSGGGGGGGGGTGGGSTRPNGNVPVNSSGRPDWYATHGYPPNYQGPPDYEQDPYAEGWRGATTRAVKAADYANELPGWVRYAMNHQGAQSLQDPRRRRLYRNRIDELIDRFQIEPQVEIPGGAGSGMNF